MPKKKNTPPSDLFDGLTADDILGLVRPVKARYRPNTKKIDAEPYFDFGRIGPVRISADGATWERLRKYIEGEPKEFLADALQTVNAAAAENPILGRPKKETVTSKIAYIAPHLYVELKYWLNRKPMHPGLSASLAHHGINPDAPGPGSPAIRVTLRLLNAVYGTKYDVRKYRTFYKNDIQPHLQDIEKIHRAAGYPILHPMFEKVFPKPKK